MTSVFQRPPRPSLPSRLLLWSTCIFGALVVAALIALLDARAGRGRVQRNVRVAGENVGRMNSDQVNSFLDRLQGQYSASTISVVPPTGGFSLSGTDLGVNVRREQLFGRLMQIGHEGNAFTRISSYAGSFFGTKNLRVPLTIDPLKTASAIREKDKNASEQPIDPKLAIEGDKFVIRPGKAGKGIATGVITATAEQKFVDGPTTLEIPVERTELPSRYSDAELRGLLDRAVALTSKPLPVRIDGKEITITPKQLRGWVTPAIRNDEVALTVDGSKALAAIVKGVGSVGHPAKDARLSVNNDGSVSAVPSEVGTKCCADDSEEVLNAALASGTGELVELKMVDVAPTVSTEAVQQLGVRELVSTFTTKHKAGEDRVKNIHHIADLLRGVVIKPGETFSVNATIGPRSAANGFVKAHVIEDGVFAENFGGGISQFATTFFNAAFFAGLELVEYQSHSLYISRYPFGREATLSYPHPDLKIKNTTPYGVMIWPTYTASSLTVNLYSAPYVKGEVIEQSIENRDQCKIVTTYRLLTYLDGRSKKDSTKARYRPAEGKDCKGNPTAGATTTVPKTTKPKTSSPKPNDTAQDGASPSDAVNTKAPVKAANNGSSGSTGTNAAGGDTPATKKPPASKTPSTKAPSKATKPDAKPEPKPDPTRGGDNGDLNRPPVTGLG